MDQPYAPGVTDSARRGHAVSRMLDTAEAASPVDAVEAVTRELGAALGAVTVSFLIADLSGRALVRLAHVVVAEPAARHPDTGGDRLDDEESAVQMPFDGGPVEAGAADPAAAGTASWRVLPGRSPCGPVDGAGAGD